MNSSLESSSISNGSSFLSSSFRLADLQLIEREPTLEWLGTASVRQALHFLPHLSLDKKTRHLESFPDQAVACAVAGAGIQEWLSLPQTWKKFSPTPEAFALRKANRFGAFFNEVGEELQERGLTPFFRGFLLPELPVPVSLAQIRTLREKGMDVRPRHWALASVHHVHPRVGTVLGQSVLDFSEAQQLPCPRELPLDFHTRFNDEDSMPDLEVSIETPSGRKRLGMEEAMAIAGISSRDLEKAFLLSAWVTGILKGFWKERQVGLRGLHLRFSLWGAGRLALASRMGLGDFDLGLLPAENLMEALHQSKSFANAAAGDFWFPTAEPLSRMTHADSASKELKKGN